MLRLRKSRPAGRASARELVALAVIAAALAWLFLGDRGEPVAPVASDARTGVVVMTPAVAPPAPGPVAVPDAQPTVAPVVQAPAAAITMPAHAAPVASGALPKGPLEIALEAHARALAAESQAARSSPFAR